MFWPFRRSRKVEPDRTAVLLYGRFLEHLEYVLDRWNDKFGEDPGHYLSDEQIEGLKEILGGYFEKWFLSKFPALEEEKGRRTI